MFSNMCAFIGAGSSTNIRISFAAKVVFPANSTAHKTTEKSFFSYPLPVANDFRWLQIRMLFATTSCNVAAGVVVRR